MTGLADRIRGYAIVWNTLSAPIEEEGQKTRERIVYRAADFLLSCSINYGHSEDTAFGSIADRSLRMWADSWGVAFEADLPLTPRGLGIRNALQERGREWGVSPLLKFFGRTIESGADGPVATVTRARIEHISITTSPCYPATSAWLASMPENLMTENVARAAFHWGVTAGRAA